jgi:Sigma-70 region 2
MQVGMAELTEVDVEAMVRDARAGDNHALGRLYDTYRDRVARFATGRLGDAEKAEDVTSETFEAVLRNLGSYRPGTDFEAWLFTIAHRRVADVFRRRSRRREVALDETVPPAVGGPTSRRSWPCGCSAGCRRPRSARCSGSRRVRCGSPSTGRCARCGRRWG